MVTTWLTNTTFHNGGMDSVQYSQAMLERGVCDLALFFSSLPRRWRSWLERSLSMREVRCSNPTRDRPSSQKQVVTALLCVSLLEMKHAQSEVTNVRSHVRWIAVLIRRDDPCINQVTVSDNSTVKHTATGVSVTGPRRWTYKRMSRVTVVAPIRTATLYFSDTYNCNGDINIQVNISQRKENPETTLIILTPDVTNVNKTI